MSGTKYKDEPFREISVKNSKLNEASFNPLGTAFAPQRPSGTDLLALPPLPVAAEPGAVTEMHGDFFIDLVKPPLPAALGSTGQYECDWRIDVEPILVKLQAFRCLATEYLQLEEDVGEDVANVFSFKVPDVSDDADDDDCEEYSCFYSRCAAIMVFLPFTATPLEISMEEATDALTDFGLSQRVEKRWAKKVIADIFGELRSMPFLVFIDMFCENSEKF